MQSAPEKTQQWVFGASELPSQHAPPLPEESETLSPPKSDFYHAGLSWTWGHGVNEGKDAAVEWMPHVEGLC